MAAADDVPHDASAGTDIGREAAGGEEIIVSIEHPDGAVQLGLIVDVDGGLQVAFAVRGTGGPTVIK